MFCLTVAHRVVLKDFLAIYSKVIGFYLYAQRLPYVQRHEPESVTFGFTIIVTLQLLQ